MEDKFIILGLLFVISVFFSKLSDKYGIPALLMFLGIGMLAGSNGIFNIYFDDAKFAGDLGTIALIYILFAGGLDTSFKAIKPVFKVGIILATFGVIITAFILAIFIHFILDFSILNSLLLASIISSTDAAVVFAILRSKNIKLKNGIGELLEFESGSNDPMAIFLTLTLISFITSPEIPSAGEWIVNLTLQFVLGGFFGYIAGLFLPSIINRMRLSVWGLYPVFMLAVVLLLFGFTSKLGGNGYIAVYVAGIFANKKEFVYKKNLVGFFDGVAWFMQVCIFLILGLLVFPNQLFDVALISLILSLILMFIARPASIFLLLIFSKFTIKEKTFISWVGFRGAVPIILATYPVIADIENAQMMFNIVFFMVLISVLIQGATIGKISKILDIRQYEPEVASVTKQPIFYSGIRQFTIPQESKFINHNLAEMELDERFLIVLIKRKEKYFKPSGSYNFEANDIILVYCQDEDLYEKIIKDFKSQ